MRHTVFDTDYDSACNGGANRNELQTMFAMMAAVRPVNKQKLFNHSKLLSHSKKRLAQWWKRRHQNQKQSVPSGLVQSNNNLNPQRAASPLLPQRPAGRRAPRVQSQQALFAVLDQMGARHAEARRSNLFD